MPFAFCLLAGCSSGGKGSGGTPAPAARRIAFVSDRDGNYEIYTINADGSDPRRLTNHPANDNIPAWSPDRQRLVFVSDRDGVDSTQIYVINADGSGAPVNLTRSPGFDGAPAWSPDGTRIAYVVGGEDIWVMNADGTGKVQLTTNPAVDGGPAWSPDGAQIYFVSTRVDGRTYLLHVMNADGTDQRAVGNNLAIDGRPAVSPDGRRLVYAAVTTAPETGIFVAHADGTSPTRLGPDNCSEPAWSPSGETITFTSLKDGDAELYSIGLNGAGLRRLTKAPSLDGGAAW